MYKFFFLKPKFFSLLNFLSLLLCSCNGTYQGPLNEALTLAEQNRSNLEAVLHHFSGNDEMREATEWLISNMAGHYTLDGPLYDNYTGYYRMFSEKGKAALPVIDSLATADGFSASTFQRRDDLRNIRAEYLVHDIELAFKTRDSLPWCANVRDEDFMRHVLPYRIKDERLTAWRDSVLTLYAPVIDSLVNAGVDDPLMAGKVLLDKWAERPFKWTAQLPQGPSAGYLSVTLKAGTCLDYAHGAVLIMRAVGIPSGVDMVPVSGDNNSGHFWPFILDREGNTFVSSVDIPRWVRADSLDIHGAKTYRTEFGINMDLAESLSCDESPAPYLLPPRITDVTSDYNPGKCHRIDLGDIGAGDAPVYLALSSNDGWIPVDRSAENGKAVFNNVAGGVVACAGLWKDRRFIPLIEPFEIIKENGGVRYIKVGPEMKKMTVFSKFPLGERSGDIVGRVVGGVIEGADNPRFQYADTIFIISDFPKRKVNVATLPEAKGEYRYYRYSGPEGSHCNIAEVALFGNTTDTMPLTGHVFGTPETVGNDMSHNYEKVWDGDLDTSFDYPEPSGGWSAIDFGKPCTIRKVMYAPRNRDNYVRKGDLYELFYFADKKWKSLGKKTAEGDSLAYRVPERALYYLKNHSRGKDERIFEYDFEKMEQHFW